MIIHRLKVSGFQIMGDPISLEFPEEGKIGILGQNESGKTTLLEAIEYALYGLKRGRAADESRENIVTWGKHEARLEIEFTSGQNRFLLRRSFDVRGGHTARLIPLVDGKEDFTKALNSLTEIETKIEQITGTDRDSFSKLVYIRQKDLDALKELAKARREQLVNKVMGIEVFDHATDKAKSDTSTVKLDLDKKKVELESVRKNAQTYEQRVSQKNLLQKEIEELDQQLRNSEVRLKETEKTLEVFDWLSRYDSTKGLISSIVEQQSRTQQDVKAIEELRGQFQRYQGLSDRYRPEITRLDGLRASFATAESRLEQANATLASLKEKGNEAIARAGLADQDRALLDQDLPSKKQHQLILFTVSLAVCITVLAVCLLLGQFLVSLLALVFGALAAKSYLAYQKIDAILSFGAEIQILQKQIAGASEEIPKRQAEIDFLAAQTNVRSLKDIEQLLSNIVGEIKAATGQESIQAIEALRDSSLGSLRKLEASNPSTKLAGLDRQLQERTEDLERLEKTRPVSLGEVRYDANEHQNAKRSVEVLRKECSERDGELQRKIGTMSQIEEDLKHLAEDFNRRPNVEAEYKALEDKARMLGIVVGELGETSRELRGKVVPHASFIINQILPTLTDGRYSQFEITEDLKFKAYSNEAGGYKEREVFSGGTQDQFLIALRLAFTQSILDSRVMADKYSLLMDECISSSDDQRKQGIFEVLDAMKKTFSQIFIIAHEDISNFVDHHIILERNQRGYTAIRSKSW
jgi:exonuclease SbcC